MRKWFVVDVIQAFWKRVGGIQTRYVDKLQIKHFVIILSNFNELFISELLDKKYLNKRWDKDIFPSMWNCKNWKKNVTMYFVIHTPHECTIF